MGTPTTNARDMLYYEIILRSNGVMDLFSSFSNEVIEV